MTADISLDSSRKVFIAYDGALFSLPEGYKAIQRMFSDRVIIDVRPENTNQRWSSVKDGLVSLQDSLTVDLGIDSTKIDVIGPAPHKYSVTFMANLSYGLHVLAPEESQPQYPFKSANAA